MKLIWILKASNDTNEDYMKKIKDAGYVPKFLPVLSFNFVNQSVIEDALNSPDKHSGIVFTSPRAVEALSVVYKKINVETHQLWSQKKIFVIGEATAKAAKEMMSFNNVIGENTYTAKNLFPVILKDTVEFDRPLLIPCGDQKRDELPRLLTNENRDFRSIVCYETLPHPDLKNTIESFITESGLPDYTIFFSPSGVKFVLPVLKSLNITETDLKYIAIGPTTNTILAENNLNVVGICPSPSPEGVLHVLKGL